MDDTTSNCPMCGEINEPSGVLGRRVHFCCRACGWWWSGINDCVEGLDVELPLQPEEE